MNEDAGEPRAPLPRVASGMKINDMLNAEEESVAPMSAGQNWFNEDERGADQAGDLTDEEPDLPVRRAEPARYYPPPPTYYHPRYEYEEQLQMTHYPMPYDPYGRREVAWASRHHPPPLPPRPLYDERYYHRDPHLPNSPYGAPPRSHLYDPRGPDPRGR
jgi:hypothetical protein